MFRTEVEIIPAKNKISYTNQLITLGSCFSDNIGQRLSNSFFQVDVNPFGVLFNPVSIKNSLELLINNRIFTEKDIFKQGSLWSSFSHSTFFSSVDKLECLNNINHRMETASSGLRRADFLLITLGTAWVYELITSGEVVSNCHKLPAKNFVRKRRTVDEVVTAYSDVLMKLHQLNPQLQVIFTVSPIRHWKDGAHENNLSKSILLMAIEQLNKQFDFTAYFPAYEIQMDELRDYRFYASDMLHPSETAIDYIWEKFSLTYFSAETQQIKTELEQWRAMLNHRPIHQSSQEYNLFLLSLEKKKEELMLKYPFLSNRLL